MGRTGLLILVLWGVSLVLGWLHQPFLLLVAPPIILFAERLLVLSAQGARMRSMGADVESRDFYAMMLLPTLGFAVWNGVICSAIFGLGWLVRSLIN